MTFDNKVVWITGASSGLGRAMAIEFAKRGATVAVSARRMELLEMLVSEIVSSGGKAKAFHCDVMDEQSIAHCVNAVVTEFGQLDVAVANAGFGVVGKIENLSDTDWNRQLTGNVIGLALTCKYSIPHLKKTKGRLVLLGSIGAFLPSPVTGAYAASKAAVHSIGETLMLELQGTGVSCTVIHPGIIDSNITRIDNKGNFNPEAKDPRPSNLMWPTEKAAKVMVNAIERRKKVYVFTGHGKVLVFIAKFLPGLARKVAAKTAPKMKE